jgi:hypothetical protein
MIQIKKLFTMNRFMRLLCTHSLNLLNSPQAKGAINIDSFQLDRTIDEQQSPSIRTSSICLYSELQIDRTANIL